MAKVSFGGMVKQVCLEYTPEVIPGDYVLVHVGFALSRIDQEEAERTYQLLEDLGQLAELDAGSTE
jgi:hydrogenase expression/formation protein HypC